MLSLKRKKGKGRKGAGNKERIIFEGKVWIQLKTAISSTFL